MAQSVERRLGKAEVTGPIPVISFRSKKGFRRKSFFVVKKCMAETRTCGMGQKPGHRDDLRVGNEPSVP